MSRPTDPTLSDAEALSALWDNQADAQQVHQAGAAFSQSDAQRDRWCAYAAIHHACQGEALAAPDRVQVRSIMEAVLAQPRPVPQVPLAPLDHTQHPSAMNDPVWRWKVAAGLLAAVAVSSIAWGLLGAAPGNSQLAENHMIHNPELEALLAEHRQHAGMSVVQMSSGFLRNATYEVPVKR